MNMTEVLIEHSRCQISVFKPLELNWDGFANEWF